MQSQDYRRRSQAVRQSSAKAPFISSILIGASIKQCTIIASYIAVFISSFSIVGYSQKKKVSPTTFKKEYLGGKINSAYNELLPIISPNGKFLYFTMGRGNPRNMGDDKYQDIYVSTHQKDGSWSYPKNIGSKFNSIADDAISGVSPDGTTLFIKNFSYNNVNGLCFAKLVSEGKWQIDSITIENYYNNNTVLSQSISTNGIYIILSIERKDGYGGLDLYVSKVKDRKRHIYSEPQNLGPVINTSKNEIAPFLASDGVTMYFTSDGLPGHGGGDVFIATLYDDSWVNWSYPVNMGPEVNTPGMDAYYSVPASGDRAYFSSSNGSNLLDLFSIKLRENQRPKPVLFLSGKVTSRTGTPIVASITCTDITKNIEVGSSVSVAEEGSFSLIAPIGDHYRIRVDAPGYLPYSDDLDLSKLSGFSELTLDIILDSIIVGSTVTLGDVFFEFNSSTLQPSSHFTLDKQAEFLIKEQSISLEIEGHTDSLGSQEYNKELSEARANAVKIYLVSKGVAAQRLTARGFGAENPVSDNASEEGRKLNRRVVFRVTNIDNTHKK